MKETRDMETEKSGVGVEENTTDSEDILRDIRITTVMIVAHLVITALFCWLAVTIIDHTLTGVIVGIIAWSLILFKTPVWDWCFINTKANWVVIMANQTTYDVVPSKLADRTDVESFPLRSMREVGPGIRGKLPWEVRSAELNLESEIVIGNKSSGSPLKCVTGNEIEVFVVWQVILTPLRGYLVNFIRQDETAVKAYFSGQFEQAILTWVKGQDEGGIAGKLSDLRLAFEHVFGGPNEVHPQERKNGTFTGDPQINSYARNAEFQQAAQAGQVAQRLQVVVQTVNAAFGEGVKPDPNVVLAAAAGLTGKPLEGVLIIPGLTGKDPKSIAALAMAAQNKQTQNKGK